VERARSERCREVIEHRAPHFANPRRRSLLTGLLICGYCGANMTASVHTTPNPDGSIRRVWRCTGKPGKLGQDGKPGCGRVSISAHPLEEHLTEHTFRQVDKSDVSELLKARASDDQKSRDLMRQIADIERRLREATESYSRPAGISLATFERTTRSLEQQKRELEGRFSSAGHTSVLWRYAGKPGALREAWGRLPIEQKNAAIKEVRGKVAILPATRRGRAAWDTNRIVATDGGFVPIRMRPLADAS
jgi:site-specific DNA recombinase